MPQSKLDIIICSILIIILLLGCNRKIDEEAIFIKPPLETNPTTQLLPPEESMEKIHLPPGYRLELVASEPMIQEPVAITWDGNGRMFVAEMRTYMQDIDGSNTNEPFSRISLLEDTNGNGKMDSHSVFIDSLVLPRMMLPLDDRLIVGETYTYDLWSYRDTNGDGIADEKKNLYSNDDEDTRNLEHQASALDWNLDNWIYVGRDPVRFRYTNGTIKADTLLDAPLSQWGVTHDDYGRLYFSLAGGEIPALGFQLNPAYGNVRLDGELAEGFQATWPITITPDVQGGSMRLRPDSTLNHFTASCGQSIFRGDRLPEDMNGDLFICEPVGRLIRRAKVTNQEGKIVLNNAYQEQEFLSSTDLNFRPVNTATGPDGALYIVDMYRGIIQESNWTREGSYIRPEILRLGLEKNVGHGRIYRLVHEDYERGPTPKMLEEGPEELVEYLSHPNGWWRDMAQRLIIVKNDRSVVPELKKIAVGSSSFLDILFGNNYAPVTKVHALWTLEGLGALDWETIDYALNDEDPQVRKTAIWISEIFLKKDNKQVTDRLIEFKDDTNSDVRIQLVSSLRYSQENIVNTTIKEMMERYSDNELLVAAAEKSLEDKNEEFKGLKEKIATYRPNDRDMILKGATIFKQTCSTCHGPDGKGLDIGNGQKLAPPLVGSERMTDSSEILIKILLDGLIGPVDGMNYPDVMPPMKHNDDEWIASVINYIQTEFGDIGPLIKSEKVKKVREDTKGKDGYWTLRELDNL